MKFIKCYLFIVTNGVSSYIALESHTGGTFATDLTANKWQLFAQGGSYVLPSVASGTGQVLGSDGANYVWTEMSTDSIPFVTTVASNKTMATDSMSFSMETISISAGATYTIPSGSYHFVMNTGGFALLQ